MAYTKLNIQAGNKLEATQLAHIESGIVANETEIAKKLGWTQLWKNASSSFSSGTITATNLSSYKLIAIVTNNGTFFCSPSLGGTAPSMRHTTIDGSTLKLHYRSISISGNNITISKNYKENLADTNGHDTENQSYLIPKYVFGLV